MNICLNYYGQPRILNSTKSNYDNFNADKHNLHILYTTWNTESIDEFRLLFPHAYIKQIEKPNIDKFKDYLTKYSMDPSNPNKTILHYLYGLYIKQKSQETIKEYPVKFDVILTLRTDCQIRGGPISKFFNNIQPNCIYVANSPGYDIYHTGSIPDMLCIATPETMMTILNQLDLFYKCCVNETNFLHPETSFYNYNVLCGIHIIRLLFEAFRWD